ncbi:MAG: diaminopimelate epimerase [Pseudomonadota bacterium]
MVNKTVISFTKMHGLGNDFVVIDNRQLQLQLTLQKIQSIADRHFGVGCDQLLLIEDSLLAQVDFKYRIFNANGLEVQQCGNGARCFALYVAKKGLSDKTTLAVETLAGIIYLYIEVRDETRTGEETKDEEISVRVNMGNPDFSPEKLPFLVKDPIAIKNNLYQLETDNLLDLSPNSVISDTHSTDKVFNFSAVSMGNPHITLSVRQLNNYKVESVGNFLLNHSAFPQGVNVGFMQIIDKNTIKLRVYERGAGETLACGSGACAAVVNGIQQGVLNHKVRVQLTNGSLFIQWNGDKTQPVWMSGPASFVFEGQIEI